MNKIILATNNHKKVEEIKLKLATQKSDIEVKTLIDMQITDDIEEYGTTFYQNALIKVEAISAIFPNQIVIADDSGLEVNALGGQPGVYSKRYACEYPGYKADVHQTNNQKLLDNLKDKEDRSTCFKTVLCVKIPKKDPIFVTGAVPGVILEKRQGEYGFGYDPIFSIDGKISYAEMTKEEKNELSHRAMAIEKLLELNIWEN